jgi:hypothetical protein
MVYPQTGSVIQTATGANTTQTAISTNIVISVGPNTVGAVQELNIDESRRIMMINEVGTDGHIDSVPNESTNITGTCRRIRFNKMRVAEAFSRSYVHVHSQRFPFDIVVIDQWNGSDNNALITTIRNVWIKRINTRYQAGDWVIADDMDWEAETIYTTLANGPSATGGVQNIPLAILSPTSDIEQAADTGGRRGALDAPGLLTAFLPY